MNASRRFAALSMVVVCLLAQPGFAQDFAQDTDKQGADTLVGTWKLVSYFVEIQATGEKLPAMGERPTGYASFLPNGRVHFMLTGDGRKPAKTDKERADLLSTMVAYSGTYIVKGDSWTTNVDVAWNPEWVGTQQVRSFKLDGDRLRILTPWRVMPNWADKGMTRSLITFERVP